MSLILEALRKSEAERQLGRAPGLLTPVTMRHAPTPYRRGLLIATSLLVLFSAVAAAWWLGRSGGTEPSVLPEPSVAVAAAQPATSQPVPMTDSPSPAMSASTPTSASAPKRESMPAVGPADMPSDPSFESTERESMPLPALPAPPRATVDTMPGEPPEAAESAPAQSVAVDKLSAPPVDSSLSNEPPATPLRMLSAEERADLPPLRLNMHVFAEAPERRFVIIDGRRLTEGDQVAANVVLMTVRRDGAVLEIRGHRVLIERP